MSLFWFYQKKKMLLFRKFSGFGCDTAAVINILAHRDATQRSLIQQEYHKIYAEDILKRLSSELSGKLEVSNINFFPSFCSYISLFLMIIIACLRIMIFPPSDSCSAMDAWTSSTWCSHCEAIVHRILGSSSGHRSHLFSNSIPDTGLQAALPYEI